MRCTVSPGDWLGKQGELYHSAMALHSRRVCTKGLGSRLLPMQIGAGEAAQHSELSGARRARRTCPTRSRHACIHT